MNTPRHPPRHPLCHWLCGVVIAAPVWALAAASPTSTPPSTPSTPSPLRSTYQVVAGDTLDKVIHKVMPDSPLRAEILRNAFVQQNPQAFTKSAPRALIPGAVLRVPSHDALLRNYLVVNEHKNWVRFP
jgi:Tfp pilus assembly protein FimV